MQDSVAGSIEEKVRNHLEVEFFSILNESDRHAGPAVDSHYSLTVVSEGFQGLSAVKRHQQLYRLVHEEMAGPVHALALHLYTPSEWKDKGMLSPDSPDCKGGSSLNT